MKYRIEYHSIQSDHIFSQPKLVVSSELIETDNWDKVVNYITEKKDLWGYRYYINEQFNTESVFGKYQFISSAGGVIIHEYTEPNEVKNLW